MKKQKRSSVPLEIERKFLIRFPDPAKLERICTKKLQLSQTYLISEGGGSRRVRKQESSEGIAYRYNEKVKLSAMTRIEREREITEKEYLELLKEAVPGSRTIEKTRYCIPSGNLCFEVDIFPEWTDRAYAEVELGSEEQDFEIPSCISVIKEVTGDGRYTNRSLAVSGFVYEEI